MKEWLGIAALLGVALLAHWLGEEKAYKWLLMAMAGYSAIAIHYLTKDLERLRKQVDYIANNTQRLPEHDD